MFKLIHAAKFAEEKEAHFVLIHALSFATKENVNLVNFKEY
jgi:hypothetical protein